METHDNTSGVNDEQMDEVPATLMTTVLNRLAHRHSSRAHQVSRQALVAAMQQPQWEQRAAAVRALGAMGTDAPLDALVNALQDEHRMVRAAAVRALGRVGAYEHIVMAYRDTDWEVREMVVLTLVEAYPAHPLLRMAAHDASSVVRAAVPASANLPRVVPRATSGKQTLGQLARHLWLVVSSQARLVHRGVWYSTALVMAAGVCFTLFAALHTRDFTRGAEIFLALTTMAATVVGVAFLTDAAHDASNELVLSSGTRLGVIMVSRMALVVGYNAVLALLASAAVAMTLGASLGALVQLWVGPVLLLSALCMALAVFAGSAVALLGSLACGALQVLQLSFGVGIKVVLQVHIWTISPLLLVLVALLIGIVMLAPREPRLQSMES